MKRLFLIPLLFILCLLSQPVQAQTGHDEVEITTIPVSDTIFMLQGAGGNIGVSIGKDGVLMIDDQYAPLSEKIIAALNALGGERPKFILNTHWHGDHTGGNEEFGATGTIIAHANVRERLMTRQEVKLFNMVSEPQPEGALPVITFDESLSIHFNGEEVEVIHFPHGHTDGDSVIFFTKSNVVHMGDHYFSGMYPFIDLDSGGDVEQFTANVGAIIEQLPPDVRIIPGHGSLSTLDELKEFHQMLKTTTAIVRDAVNAGKSLEETVAAGFPPEVEAKWGQGFLSTDKWIPIVYKSLSE